MKPLFTTKPLHPYFVSHPDARRRYVGLVGCGKAKLPYAAPAAEIYTGGLTKLSIAWAKRNCEVWYILSAKYGLLSPDEIIEPYELSLKSLDEKQLKKWKDKVNQKMVPGLTEAVWNGSVLFCCGQEYIRGTGLQGLDVFGTGMKMGKRMQWLKQNPVLTDEVLVAIKERNAG